MSELAEKRPVCVSLDGVEIRVRSWSDVFSCVVSRLVAAHEETFVALQSAGELGWLGCGAGNESVAAVLEAGRLNPQFADWAEVVARVQWLFLMCGIRLNEVVVQVDPYTNEAWRVRKPEIDRKRAEEKAFMEGRRAAQIICIRRVVCKYCNLHFLYRAPSWVNTSLTVFSIQDRSIPTQQFSMDFLR